MPLPAAASIALKALVTPLMKAALATPRGLATLRESRRRTREGARLVGAHLTQRVDYRVPGLNHPLLTLREPHPDDFHAFCALAGPSLERAARSDWIEVADQVETDYGHNLVLIGSPESEPLLRLVFDYRRRDFDKPDLRYVGQTIRLPYRWNEDQREVTAVGSRFVAGAGLVERPNWPLVHTNPHGEERWLSPRVDHEGMLESDWLLLTVVPNFLTREGLESGRTIISVAGTHGLGTRSISLVLSNARHCRDIEARLRDRPAGYQVVIEALAIRHDEDDGSRATEVRVHDVVDLGLSRQALLAANREVSERFSDWIVEDLERHKPLPGERR